MGRGEREREEGKKKERNMLTVLWEFMGISAFILLLLRFFIFNFCHYLIMMCLVVVSFMSNLFGTLCASWTYMSISFSKLWKFSFITFSNKFSISCSSSSPSGTPMLQMLVHLEMSQRLLSVSLFF